MGSNTPLLAENTLIKQAEQQIEQRLKAGMREPVMKLVVAGMKVAMKGGPDSPLAKLKQSENVLEDCVKGAVGLVNTLRRAAKGAAPVSALVPAAMILALQALDFAERAGVIKVTKEVLDQATELFTETILPAMGVSPAQMKQLTERTMKVANDPEKMRQIYVPKPSQLTGA